MSLNKWIRKEIGEDAERKLRKEFGGQLVYVKKKPDAEEIRRAFEDSGCDARKAAQKVGVAINTVYSAIKKKHP